MTLSEWGANEAKVAEMISWTKERSVTLVLRSVEKCTFVRKEEKQVESDSKHVTKSTVFGKSESYTVTKVRSTFSVILDADMSLC